MDNLIDWPCSPEVYRAYQRDGYIDPDAMPAYSPEGRGYLPGRRASHRDDVCAAIDKLTKSTDRLLGSITSGDDSETLRKLQQQARELKQENERLRESNRSLLQQLNHKPAEKKVDEVGRRQLHEVDDGLV